MTDQDDKIFNAKRAYFDSGATKPYAFRIEQLKKLKSAIKKHEHLVIKALYDDMHKPAFEAYVSEIGIIYGEINLALKKLKSWMRPQRVGTPLSIQPSVSKIYSEPLGVVLIIGPWNYPFQLIIGPLIGAIAAGNCVLLKPSEIAVHTANILEVLISDTFSEDYISVVQGSGLEIEERLLKKYPFDHLFFTGSGTTGKRIMRMAAEHLTPVTLELGGKSPAIVMSDADLDVAARRLVWAKYFNSGQTCVCPDYLLIHESVKEAFVIKMIDYLKDFYGEHPLKSEDLAHIINEGHFNTLVSYLKGAVVLHGGDYDPKTLAMEPTIVDHPAEDHPLMQGEIFGPILPVLSFREIEDVVPVIRRHRSPLSCYVFTSDKKTEEFIIRNIEFGGGCVNNAIAHLANPQLPFGGVGKSGMGGCRGKTGFDTFSHKKSILKTSVRFDPSLRYPPYKESKWKWVRYFLE